MRATLDAADGQAFTSAVRLLADRKRRVLVIAGDAERGIATSAADHLGQLREGVEVQQVHSDVRRLAQGSQHLGDEPPGGPHGLDLGGGLELDHTSRVGRRAPGPDSGSPAWAACRMLGVPTREEQ